MDSQESLDRIALELILDRMGIDEFFEVMRDICFVKANQARIAEDGELEEQWMKNGKRFNRK